MVKIKLLKQNIVIDKSRIGTAMEKKTPWICEEL